MTVTGPRVSVIIPAYYSAGTLESCLESLNDQTFRDFEIILVNSSAERQTAQIAARTCPRARFIQSDVRLLPHGARNLGVKLAAGELLVFTDPDCTAAPDWLERLVAAYDDGVEVMVGAMGLASDNWKQQGIHLCKFHWLLPGLPVTRRYCAPTANAAYSRRIWQRIGPFPADIFAGDGVLSWQAIQAAKVWPTFISTAITRHSHDESVGAFCRNRFLRGREYAIVQLTRMSRSSFLDRLRLLMGWSALGLVLARAGRDAIHAGWTVPFCMTLPIQAAGHLCWAVGEGWGTILASLGQGEAKPGQK